jgi:endoglucanase
VLSVQSVAKLVLSVLSVAALLAVQSVAQPQATDSIKVNQVGYITDAPKIAFVAASATASNFTVRRIADGTAAFSAVASAAVSDPDSGDRVQALDFSGLRRDGEYYIEVSGVGRSWPFRIGPNVYARAFYLAMRSYYGQRCGTAVDLGREFPGYSHPACHLRGAFHSSSGKSGDAPSAGGWHDAGDYGRYVVNSGISTGTLLWTWELFGKQLNRVSLDIPESHNAIPDILDEIKWNLDWMLSMQDTDGGVWHKQTSERFAPFVAPQDDRSISYIVGTGSEPFKSSCATGDLAAVMAIASRVYRPFDSAYADRALDAAKRAWTWLDAHPSVLFRNPPAVSTGEYGDRNCADERLWAAAELARSTHERAYDSYLTSHYPEFLPSIRSVGPQSWSNVAPLALWTYALAFPDQASLIVQRSREAADAIVERTSRNAYRHALATSDYVWGSNGVEMNYGMQLLVTNALHPDRRYVDTALDTLHYVLGRNTFSLSWVTQLGAHPFRHPHHRPSAADAHEEPWPGLMSGGPNRHRQDPAMAKLPDLPPARMYLDEQPSYATNEVAINWNASLVFVLASTQR